MTVTAIDKDPATRTMTLTAEFAAPVELVWQMISDPRRLERWWGPPGYPATFHAQSFVVGELTNYEMNGPEGDSHLCWWRPTAIDAPRLEAEEGFCDATGQPSTEMPSMAMRFDVIDLGSGKAQLRLVTTFPSVEAMEQMVAMGMDEGMTEAAGQIDALLLEYAAA
jgi:uncharacterized protein YndB with AHSA1/START domain